MATLSDRNTYYVSEPSLGDATKLTINTLPGTTPRLVTSEQLPYLDRRDSIKVDEAVKFDEGKADWSLVPFEALEGMTQVLTFGSKKYAAWNWQLSGGFKWTRVLASCLRHLFAFMRGQDNDPESGLSHISHAQCNLLFLAYYIRNKNKDSKDDRNVL